MKSVEGFLPYLIIGVIQTEILALGMRNNHISFLYETVLQYYTYKHVFSVYHQYKLFFRNNMTSRLKFSFPYLAGGGDNDNFYIYLKMPITVSNELI